MKLTSLSKSVCTILGTRGYAIGIMGLLSITIGTSAQASHHSKPSATTAIARTIARPAPTQSIVQIAAGNSNFSTLVTAVQAAGLAETLSGKGPFTVFAPTNAAFAALPKGTLDKLLKPENRNLLRKVLTYHVVSGDLMARNLRSGRVTTVEGNRVTVRVRHGRVRVNNANVITADIDAKNGVIHAIDRVLLPPGL